MRFVVINQSTLFSDRGLEATCQAFNNEVATFCELTNTAPASALFVGKDVPAKREKGDVYCYVQDVVKDAPQGAIAWHLENTDGSRDIYFNVSTIIGQGGGEIDGGTIGWSGSEALTHEFGETMKDAPTTFCTFIGGGKFLASEVGDPVEGTPFPVPVTLKDGTQETVLHTNYVSERFFDPLAPTDGSVALDRNGKCKRPLVKLNTGYEIVYDAATDSWTNAYGTEFPEHKKASKEAKLARVQAKHEARKKAHAERHAHLAAREADFTP